MTATQSPASPRRAELSDLGIHQLGLLLVMLQAGVLCVSVPLFHYVGLSLELKTATIVFVLGGPFVIPWLYFLRYPGRNPRDWIFAESFFVLTLTLTTVLIT